MPYDVLTIVKDKLIDTLNELSAIYKTFRFIESFQTNDERLIQILIWINNSEFKEFKELTGDYVL